LLRNAGDVRIVRVDSSSERRNGDNLPGPDICAALARHGVKCRATEEVAARGGVGETLTACAGEMGADLLVMGCYGHTRFRELLLGGASRHMLAHMPIPVLMSH